MMLFHYLDYESDRHAVPLKRTTIVYLGLHRSKVYVMILLLLSTALSVAMALQISPLFFLVTLSNMIQFVIQARCNPSNAESIVKTGKILTFEMIGFSIVFCALINPSFAWITVWVILSFYLHKKFGKLKTA